MIPVNIASDNIITSLGFTTDGNIMHMKEGQTGITLHKDERLSPDPFWASIVDRSLLLNTFAAHGDPAAYTVFEQLVICSIREALGKTDLDVASPRTLLILSTTKGNVALLDHHIKRSFEEDRVYLWHTASLLQEFFHLHHRPLVVSNACISGVLAILVGTRLIRAGQYDHIIVCGADQVTEFVLSGFKSFQSLYPGPCRPFDKDRQGLSLGEGAGTVILTNNPAFSSDHQPVHVGEGFTANDANHISGPSRTGEGLFIAIRRALETTDRKIDYISAHGTGTPYNDEMEAIAITRAGLQHVPVNSLKGYWGHTLGAAGVIESVACIYSLKNNMLLNTLGFASPGVTQPVAVIDATREETVNTCLKLASGFGGSNASILYYK